jgi:hypothetical protein
MKNPPKKSQIDYGSGLLFREEFLIIFLYETQYLACQCGSISCLPDWVQALAIANRIQSEIMLNKGILVLAWLARPTPLHFKQSRKQASVEA